MLTRKIIRFYKLTTIHVTTIIWNQSQYILHQIFPAPIAAFLPYQHYQNLQPTSHLKLEFNTKTLPTPILVAVHFLSKPIKNSIHHYSPWTSFFVLFFFCRFSGGVWRTHVVWKHVIFICHHCPSLNQHFLVNSGRFQSHFRFPEH